MSLIQGSIKIQATKPTEASGDKKGTIVLVVADSETKGIYLCTKDYTSASDKSVWVKLTESEFWSLPNNPFNKNGDNGIITDRSFTSNSYISCKGIDTSAGAGGGGADSSLIWGTLVSSGLIPSGNGKIHSDKLPANTVYTDASGKIPSSALPSYVDDVLEGTMTTNANGDGTQFVYTSDTDESSVTLTTGERGKIYVDITSGVAYRWSGSTWTPISDSRAEIASLNNKLDIQTSGSGSFIKNVAFNDSDQLTFTKGNASVLTFKVTPLGGSAANLGSTYNGSANQTWTLTAASIVKNLLSINTHSDFQVISGLSQDATSGIITVSYKTVAVGVKEAVANATGYISGVTLDTTDGKLSLSRTALPTLSDLGGITPAAVDTKISTALSGLKKLSIKLGSDSATAIEYHPNTATSITISPASIGALGASANAVSASKWATARKFKIADSNAALSDYQPSSNVNSGAEVSVDGSSTAGYTLTVPKKLNVLSTISRYIVLDWNLS